MTPRYGIVPPRRQRRGLSPLAAIGLTLAVLAALFAMTAALGSRFDWWHFRTGFQYLRWATYGGLAAAGISLLALIILLVRRARGALLAVLGIVIGLSVAAVPWQWQRIARGAPPIHDVTTDTQTPPEFIAIAPLRADAPNPPEYAGEEAAALQRQAYPDIAPLMLALPAAQAFEHALAAAHDMGWEIVAADAAQGRIEATDRTFWFGFLDDVVVRVTGEQGGARIDVRSKSRVGRGDVGTNARRIRRYLERIEGRV